MSWLGPYPHEGFEARWGTTPWANRPPRYGAGRPDRESVSGAYRAVDSFWLQTAAALIVRQITIALLQLMSWRARLFRNQSEKMTL